MIGDLGPTNIYISSSNYIKAEQSVSWLKTVTITNVSDVFVISLQVQAERKWGRQLTPLLDILVVYLSTPTDMKHSETMVDGVTCQIIVE